MVTIFISHSKKDEDLVLGIKKILENIGHAPIIEEFISKEKQQEIPYEEIRSNVNKSSFVFLFLTDSVIETEYTKSWIIYEVGVASNASIRVFVFERIGTPIPYPIPYVTDFALFNPDRTDDMLEIQKLAKNLGKIRRDLLTAGAGAAVGSMFGPLGLVLGAIGGYVLGPKQEKPPRVKCPHCSVTFNYYSLRIKDFNCPCCRKQILLR